MKGVTSEVNYAVSSGNSLRTFVDGRPVGKGLPLFAACNSPEKTRFSNASRPKSENPKLLHVYGADRTSSKVDFV